MDGQLVTIHAICFIVRWIDFIINCVRTVVIFTRLTMSFNTEHMAHVNAGNTETSCNCGETNTIQVHVKPKLRKPFTTIRLQVNLRYQEMCASLAIKLMYVHENFVVICAKNSLHSDAIWHVLQKSLILKQLNIVGCLIIFMFIQTYLISLSLTQNLLHV